MCSEWGRKGKLFAIGRKGRGKETTRKTNA
jgi:hypothetical protein